MFASVCCFCFFFFFFQAEDGIRDLYVTGVQTCALPICPIMFVIGACSIALLWLIVDNWMRTNRGRLAPEAHVAGARDLFRLGDYVGARSEERRVGKECRSRWAAYESQKNRRVYCHGRVW